ncbi:MAG: 50S ribosomal protein L25/general stress protein Ctc [Deltaproteobacteria bacterium]|nr:50S ribosomal protein L25/general stress protein Ctc [Deltaproteobacteria bacterium]
MDRLEVQAQNREATGKGVARKLRAQGRIPCVLYGKDIKPVSLSVNDHDFEKTIHQAGGMNSLFDLIIDGKEKMPVMVREYQADNIRRNFLHVDFIQVDLSKKINVEVPVELVGVAPGVKEGGILDHIQRQLEVICLPTSIPEKIEVDVSGLNLGESLHIHDIKLPEGVEVSGTTDLTIAAVVAPKAEKVKAASEEEGEGATEEKTEA